MNRKRVAVFLRGMQRTWPHIKEHTQYLFDRLYGVENVDWYIAFWETKTSSTVDHITQCFSGRNLVFCETTSLDHYPLKKITELKYKTDLFHYQQWKGYNSGYWHLAYLDTLLIAKKSKHEIENEFFYDKVFFIRPDVYYKINDIDAVRKPLNEFEVTGLNYYTIEGNIVTDDLYYQTTSLTADILCSRFLDTHTAFNIKQLTTRCPHALIGQFLSRNYLTPVGTDNDAVELIIVRPDVLDSIVNVAQLDKMSCRSWISLDDHTRLMYCQKHNIDPEEYGI